MKHYAQRWKFQLSSPQKHEIRSNQQAVKQSFIITPLQQSVSVWCKADLPLDLSSTWLSVPPLAFSLTSLCPSPHLSIHHLGGQRKSINPSTPSFTPLDWWEGGQEMGEPWIFHNIFVALEKKNCIALHQMYSTYVTCYSGLAAGVCVSWLSESVSWYLEKLSHFFLCSTVLAPFVFKNSCYQLYPHTYDFGASTPPKHTPDVQIQWRI